MKAVRRAVMLAFILTSISTRALATQSPQPGDTCTTTGAFVTNSGPAQTPGLLLVCDGSVWNLFLGFTSAGHVGIGTSSPASLLELAINGSVGATQYCDTSGANCIVPGSPPAAAWSGLTNPTANLALTMAGYTSTLTYNATTGAGVDLFKLTDTASNTGTGYLMNLATATSSTLRPFHVGAAGVDALTVLANGNIGIATTAPAASLDVNGQIISRPFALTDGATVAVDWSKGNVQYVTIAGNRTFTFTGGLNGGRYILAIKQDSTGSRTVTWPASVRWSGGAVPTLTTTAAKTDYLTFIFNPVSSTYDGVGLVQNF